MNKFKMLRGVIGICVAEFIAAPHALSSPIIGIGSMYDVLIPGTESLTKRIYNTGSSMAFVRVDLLDIEPEKNANKEKELTTSSVERNRLIVTPQRLIISPGGFQSIRILWPGERNQEKYFRIRFTPVIPEAGDSFGLDNTVVSEYRKTTLQAGLTVLTGYGTIVIVQPDKPIFSTVIDDLNSKFIIVSNKGNATISLDNIRQCKFANTDCSAVTRELILPGRTHRVEKKNEYKTNFTLVEGLNKKVMSY